MRYFKADEATLDNSGKLGDQLLELLKVESTLYLSCLLLDFIFPECSLFILVWSAPLRIDKAHIPLIVFYIVIFDIGADLLYFWGIHYRNHKFLKGSAILQIMIWLIKLVVYAWVILLFLDSMSHLDKRRGSSDDWIWLFVLFECFVVVTTFALRLVMVSEALFLRKELIKLEGAMAVIEVGSQVIETVEAVVTPDEK
eukprot:TRINITY_DN7349_c0_g1_i1.p1 TRINITY_DN7349_c0_g1~~TRINITY_DN7349_c0_g1_i1.p1  ORF type:complete len:198 (-),score=8.21 TRINITY_DN7349_c0_g1_i1:41-634(-)